MDASAGENSPAPDAEDKHPPLSVDGNKVAGPKDRVLPVRQQQIRCLRAAAWRLLFAAADRAGAKEAKDRLQRKEAAQRQG